MRKNLLNIILGMVAIALFAIIATYIFIPYVNLKKVEKNEEQQNKELQINPEEIQLESDNTVTGNSDEHIHTDFGIEDDTRIYITTYVYMKNDETKDQCFKKLENCTFYLYDEEVKYIAKIVTDEDGYTGIKGLGKGTYYFELINVPEGYEEAQKSPLYKIIITDTSRKFYKNFNFVQSRQCTFFAKVLTAKGQPIKDIEMELYDEKDRLVKELITKTQGLVGVNNLPYGKYYAQIKDYEKYGLTKEDSRIDIDFNYNDYCKIDNTFIIDDDKLAQNIVEDEKGAVFVVLKDANNDPINDYSINIYKFNEETNGYEFLLKREFKNTDAEERFKMSGILGQGKLEKGKYKVEVVDYEKYGIENATAEFEIGNGNYIITNIELGGK